ncbi:MAG: phytanoyl-CoA dioxygenase family protein [Armatimonadetes bacterium]|nr:phytanoyl-CoA dioxygenase family protein [Armatimonadota bacterium]
MLSANELSTLSAEFAENGYAVVRGVFAANEVAEIRDTFMEQAKRGPVDGLSESLHVAKDDNDPLKKYPRMMHPHLHTDKPVGAVSLKYMLDERVYTLLSAIMQTEPAAAQSMFYFKPAGARGQELHQDNFYLRVAPDTCYAAWVAVDDADAENGTMMVVPGSQALPIFCPDKADVSTSFTSDFVPIPDGLKAVEMNLKAGDVLFFNGSVIHGSYPNTSIDRFRRAFICHYLPANSIEIQPSYPTMAFTGERIKFGAATGGGACGNQFGAGAVH